MSEYKKDKNLPTLDEMRESMNQMRIKEYIDLQIDELNDLSKLSMLLYKFNYEEVSNFNVDSTTYCIFLLSKEELQVVKDLIRMLNLEDQVKLEFQNERFPDSNDNIFENMELKYHVVLSGREEQLWFFNVIFNGEWLELYLAFEYKKEHRYDIFPEDFLETLDYIKDNSWGTKEYILPNIRKKIREISNFLAKPENRPKGMILPKMNFSLIFTPYHNHRINEYKIFGGALRNYITDVVIHIKKNNMQYMWFDDVRDISIFYKAINFGEQAIKKYALKELRKKNFKDFNDIGIINDKYIWLEELTEVLDYEIKNSDFTEIEISNIRIILKNYFIDPEEMEEDHEAEINNNILKALKTSNIKSEDFKNMLGNIIVNDLENNDETSLEDESSIKIIKVDNKDLPKDFAKLLEKIQENKGSGNSGNSKN